jgi:ubiquinone/menaquinone biosynthesis C-methylase UbiE
VAPVYDRSVALVGWHRWQDALLADVTEGAVLDVGCGPAHLAKGLMARGVDYVGLDRNLAMLARAAGAVDTWGPGRGLVVRGDVSALPFDASSFDVVVATGVLGLLTAVTRHAVLAEMVRVSRGEIRLLEPIIRADAPLRLTRSRIVAPRSGPAAHAVRAGRGRARAGGARSGSPRSCVFDGGGDAG